MLARFVYQDGPRCRVVVPSPGWVLGNVMGVSGQTAWRRLRRHDPCETAEGQQDAFEIECGIGTDSIERSELDVLDELRRRTVPDGVPWMRCTHLDLPANRHHRNAWRLAGTRVYEDDSAARYWARLRVRNLLAWLKRKADSESFADAVLGNHDTPALARLDDAIQWARRIDWDAPLPVLGRVVEEAVAECEVPSEWRAVA